MDEFRITIRFSDGGSQRHVIPLTGDFARRRVTIFDILERALDLTGIDEAHVIGFKADRYRDGYKVT